MINVIHHMCQPWLYKKSQCRLCIEACPVEDCMRFEGDSVSVDDEKCVGCGICTNACPSGALVLEELSDGELWNRLNADTEAGGILFGCTLRPEDIPPAPPVPPEDAGRTRRRSFSDSAMAPQYFPSRSMRPTSWGLLASLIPTHTVRIGMAPGMAPF